MPSIGFGEILVILVLALIVFGPKRLPEMGRSLGRSLREFRRATSDFRAEFERDLDDDLPHVPSPADRRIPGGEASTEPPRGEAPPT